jgi:hypothetical protein
MHRRDTILRVSTSCTFRQCASRIAYRAQKARFAKRRKAETTKADSPK